MGGEGRGEISPNDSRIEPLNRSRRRKEAERVVRQEGPPPHVGGYPNLRTFCQFSDFFTRK